MTAVGTASAARSRSTRSRTTTRSTGPRRSTRGLPLLRRKERQDSRCMAGDGCLAGRGQRRIGSVGAHRRRSQRRWLVEAVVNLASAMSSRSTVVKAPSAHGRGCCVRAGSMTEGASSCRLLKSPYRSLSSARGPRSLSGLTFGVGWSSMTAQRQRSGSECGND